ncbi:hypothetical protein HMPREF9098_0150 [Kingella denitrificans ATCC 33394]|uniref:Uncharacterized protein n=1 Tax=Kingella denitrificans ATCC 33394 TaxID=888741 RepID=F0EWB7_9NEIS|nr:hypothetical protein HMPREF9098_0150 [Kingella denitrificans ATCC 33394]
MNIKSSLHFKRHRHVCNGDAAQNRSVDIWIAVVKKQPALIRHRRRRNISRRF